MASIAWTAEAQRWLQEIHDYIAQDNPSAASRTVDGLIERTELLLTFPEIGYRYGARVNVRVLLFGHYRIAYLIKPDGDIDILGVFHGALEIEQYLR